jgi:hypothetical protein
MEFPFVKNNKPPINSLMLAACCMWLLQSCAVPKNFPVYYYKTNEKIINNIEKQYSRLYTQKPIAAAFTDKDFEHVSVEMKTDTLRYIYEFDITDPTLKDTLQKFGYDTTGILQVLRNMKQIKCTWINTLDYYVDGNKRLLTFLSVRHRAMDVPFSSKKYIILTFYKQPQYYDSEGRLLDKKSVRRLRRINNEEFQRINDRVCYTLSSHFR